MHTQPVPMLDWLVVLPVILPLVGTAGLLVARPRVTAQAVVAVLVTIVMIAGEAVLLTQVGDQGAIAMTMGNWLPPFGISFTVDVTGATFALVAAIVTLLVLVFARMQPADKGRRAGFFPLTLALLAGVSGAFLTGDLFNLYVWFELILIASFGLLVLEGAPLSLDGAVKYGLLNFLGTSLFLAGLGLLYGTLGTLNMADIIHAARGASPAMMTAIAALFLVAFGVKAAVFPLNAWLPAAYHAPPAAISALLGGLLTKVGAYALLRTLVLLLPAAGEALRPLVIGLAVATLLLAPLGAIAETNLRRAVGYLLIGGIGSILAGLAFASVGGIAGAAAYIVHAMLTISALYLTCGLIEHRAGTTDSRQMGGFYAGSTWLSLLFLALVFAVAGVPPFLGFWPKLQLVEAGIAAAHLAGRAGPALDPCALGLSLCLLLNALLTLFAGLRLWSHIFWRPGPADAVSETATVSLRPLTRRENAFGLGATIGLTAVILLIGFWPQPLLAFGRAAAAGLLEPGPYIRATGLGDSP